MSIPFIGKIFGSGIKETAEAIGSLSKDIREAITGEISPEKKAEIEQKMLELQVRTLEMQNKINLGEANSPKLFVAGWRPFIGWVCGFALCWNYIIHPIFCWITALAGLGVKPPPVLGLGEMMPILLGMLGLAGCRSYEKKNKVYGLH